MTYKYILVLPYMQLPRIKHRTSFDDKGIKNMQQDLCHFIHCECCHKDGRFFNTEDSLATSDKYKSLLEWNNAMP